MSKFPVCEHCKGEIRNWKGELVVDQTNTSKDNAEKVHIVCFTCLMKIKDRGIHLISVGRLSRVNPFNRNRFLKVLREVKEAETWTITTKRLIGELVLYCDFPQYTGRVVDSKRSEDSFK
ncbi:MAG: hypothetical protein GX020_02835 [Firmicutes bacterium]|nr:hypothetical protein [Bacillota bacterium]